MSNFFCSSIGKKLLMSLAGLFLVVFLLVHLGINLLILSSDKGEAFRVAVEFMGSPVIKVMEIFLMAGFAVHIIWALILFVQNMIARPQGYAITNHSQTSFFSKYMIHTGLIIFTFLVIHFINFYFVKLGIVSMPEGAESKHDFYFMVIRLFKQPVYSIIYVAFMLFLSFHMLHAFQSAFQTLGINHKKYSPIIKYVGIAYSILVPLGFAIIPIYVYFWM
jgi:succinate dehydrogenase / fumarate reductase, cytochrome b subunit